MKDGGRETRGYEASSCRRAWKGGVQAEETARFKGAETGKSRLATSTSVFLSVNWRPWHSLPAGGVGVIVKIITILRCTSSFTKADLSASLGNRFTNHCCECRSRIWFRCWNGPTYRHTRLHACTLSSHRYIHTILTRAHTCTHIHTHTQSPHTGFQLPDSTTERVQILAFRALMHSARSSVCGRSRLSEAQKEGGEAVGEDRAT